MARKESVTKDIILETALALAKEEGIGNVTARKLAAKIGCSTQPIFRVYANMGELCGDINQKAAEVFSDYYENYESEVDTPFIHLGLAYIDFAKEESVSGIPFIDSRCTVESENVIIYSHNNEKTIVNLLEQLLLKKKIL